MDKVNDFLTWFYLGSIKAVNQSINDYDWVNYPENVKIEEERSYFCTNINWIGAEDVLNDSDIVINFAEKNQVQAKNWPLPPLSAQLDQVSQA